MTMGDRIKARRIEVGLTVDQVAERIGKNRATVYRYESNDIEKFTLDVLYPLADALQTTPAYLMGWESCPNQSVTVFKSNTEGQTDKNVLLLAGRDGSFQKRILSDQQLSALKAILDQMPDASEDL